MLYEVITGRGILVEPVGDGQLRAGVDEVDVLDVVGLGDGRQRARNRADVPVRRDGPDNGGRLYPGVDLQCRFRQCSARLVYRAGPGPELQESRLS